MAGGTGLPVELFRAWQVRLQILDAAGVGGVSGEEFRRLSAALGVHVLPQLNGLPRIKAGLRHQLQADQVGLGFLGAAEGQGDTVLDRKSVV